MALSVSFYSPISSRVLRLGSLSSANGFLCLEGFVGVINGCYLLSAFVPMLFSSLAVFALLFNWLIDYGVLGRSH